MLKYVSPSFSEQLLDKWNEITQGNKSTTNYVTKFDEYLSRCGAIEFETSKRTLSRFRSDIRDDCRRELIAQGITTLEQIYQLVTDLDESRGSYFHRYEFRDSSKTTTASKPIYSRSFSVPNKHASSSSCAKPACSFSAKPTTFEKKTASELTKVNPCT